MNFVLKLSCLFVKSDRTGGSYIDKSTEKGYNNTNEYRERCHIHEIYDRS